MKRFKKLFIWLLIVLFTVSVASGCTDLQQFQDYSVKTISDSSSTDNQADQNPDTENTEAIPAETENLGAGNLGTENLGTENPEIESTETQMPEPASETEIQGSFKDSKLQVHFIDVGQGDCTLITCDGESMLIDAGDNSKGTTVQLYLKKHNIDKLKYVIGTHPDEDHIGGLDVIIYKYDCEKIIMPLKENDTATYRDVIDTIDGKNYKITAPEVGDTYTLGAATFTIIAPRKYYDDSNNCSVAIRLTHGENSFVFVGDAEEEEESDMLWSKEDLKADVIKIGHHGSNTATGKSFLKAVAPTYAVISCGKGNSYGHPHKEVMDRLKSQGVSLFRTDEQGSIVAESDGSTLKWDKEPTTVWTPGASKIEEDEPSSDTGVTRGNTGASDGTTYIINTNTKKFHYPSCKSVKQMKDKNKKESNEDRDVLIKQGYKPCQNCNP